MSLVGLLIFVIIVGLLLYLIQVLPLQPPFKTVAYVILVIIAVLWLLGGISGSPITLR